MFSCVLLWNFHFFSTLIAIFIFFLNCFLPLLIPDFFPPRPWPYLSQALRTLSCLGGIQLRMKSEGWENPPTKSWVQTVFLLQLPPPPGSAKFPFHEPPGEQISELPRSWASLPPPVPEHLCPCGWRFTTVQGMGRGHTQPRWVSCRTQSTPPRTWLGRDSAFLLSRCPTPAPVGLLPQPVAPSSHRRSLPVSSSSPS